MYINTISKK